MEIFLNFSYILLIVIFRTRVTIDLLTQISMTIHE